ncbi:TPA: hypothetical protein ACOEP6_004660 [Enterobacter ludwigii]
MKHESEWLGGSANPKWKEVLAPMSGDFLAYVKQWLDAHEWIRWEWSGSLAYY